MSFMLILKSLDELLYEVMSWIVFYPLTLWRAIRHPRRMMAYADDELADPIETQYTDALSPLLFLLLTLLLGHAIELAVVGDSPIVNSNVGLNRLIDSDSNLIAIRLAGFAIFPLMIALRLVRRQHKKIDRETLKLPFYAQCYATVPMALLFSVAGTLLQCRVPWLELTGLVMVLVGKTWFLVLQTDWFHRKLRTTWLRAFGNAARCYAEALAMLVLAYSLLV